MAKKKRPPRGRGGAKAVGGPLDYVCPACGNKRYESACSCTFAQQDRARRRPPGRGARP